MRGPALDVIPLGTISRLVSRGETESEGEFPCGISVTRIQSIEQGLIDQTVIELLRLCRSFNGAYDGWETRVVTQ
jgi:hypothetical protein